MIMIFHFPIYHKGCDTCESRFECMTMRIHKEYPPGYKPTYRRNVLCEYIPFRFSLACFKLEPHKYIRQIRLEISGSGMQVTAEWG